MKKQLTFTKIDREKRYNMINPDNGDRMGNYDIAAAIKSKWEFSREDISGCGNVEGDCSFDLEKGEVVWGAPFSLESIKFYNLISSPLLLYRLLCVFQGVPFVAEDPYKVVWSYTLRHVETGKHLSFSEWKGASGFWLPDTRHTELKETFKSDLEDLLLFIISDQIPHPYDGCTAGQVA